MHSDFNTVLFPNLNIEYISQRPVKKFSTVVKMTTVSAFVEAAVGRHITSLVAPAATHPHTAAVSLLFDFVCANQQFVPSDLPQVQCMTSETL